MCETPGLAHCPLTRWTLILSGTVSAVMFIGALNPEIFFALCRPFGVRVPELPHNTALDMPFGPPPSDYAKMLMGALLLYRLRVIERLYGEKKFIDFFWASNAYLMTLQPLLMNALRYALTDKAILSFWNAMRPEDAQGLIFRLPVPAGIVFAELAQYHFAVPFEWRYGNASASQPPNTDTDARTATQQQDSAPWEIVVTSKYPTYLLAGCLALSGRGEYLVQATCGWIIGYAWLANLLPWPW